MYDNNTQLVEKGGSIFFLKEGVQLLKGGGDTIYFYLGDYVTELADSHGNLKKN